MFNRPDIKLQVYMWMLMNFHQHTKMCNDHIVIIFPNINTVAPMKSMQNKCLPVI